MIELEFGRVRFRPVERGDLPLRVQWLNDPAVQNTLSYEMPVTLEKTEAWLERHRDNPSRADFSVLTTEGEYIGFCGLLDIDRAASKAEHYITLGNETFRGKGFGRESYILLQMFAFDELGLNRLYGYQLTNNVAGHRLIEKLGWTREGLLRQDKLSHGKIVDRFIVSLLRSEWNAGKNVPG